METETGVLRTMIYSKLLTKSYNILMANMGPITDALLTGDKIEIDLSLGASVCVDGGELVLTSTLKDGKKKNITLNQDNLLKWLEKEPAIEEEITSLAEKLKISDKVHLYYFQI